MVTLVADPYPARAGNTVGLAGRVSELLVELVWVPGGVLIYGTVWFFAIAVVKSHSLLVLTLVVSSMMAVGWTVATVIVKIRSGESVIFSIVLVLNAPSKWSQRAVKRTIGRFVTGFMVVSFAIAAIIGLVVVVFGVIAFRTGFNQYGMWTRGISPVGAIVAALIFLVLFFLWVLAVIMSILPYVFGCYVVASAVSSFGLGRSFNPDGDFALLVFVAVIMFVFLWLPSSATWILEQGRENEDGMLIFPRFQLRRGGPSTPVTIRPTRWRIAPTLLIFFGVCLLTFPMGPFRDVEEWECSRWAVHRST